jgi:hypothetical protein
LIDGPSTIPTTTIVTATNTIGTGYWSVPPVPSDKSVQTLFLFTGFQNSYFLYVVEQCVMPDVAHRVGCWRCDSCSLLRGSRWLL